MLVMLTVNSWFMLVKSPTRGGLLSHQFWDKIIFLSWSIGRLLQSKFKCAKLKHWVLGYVFWRKRFAGFNSVKTFCWVQLGENVLLGSIRWKRFAGFNSVKTFCWVQLGQNVLLGSTRWKHFAGFNLVKTYCWVQFGENVLLGSIRWKRFAGFNSVKTFCWVQFGENALQGSTRSKRIAGFNSVKTFCWERGKVLQQVFLKAL